MAPPYRGAGSTPCERVHRTRWSGLLVKHYLVFHVHHDVVLLRHLAEVFRRGKHIPGFIIVSAQSNGAIITILAYGTFRELCFGRIANNIQFFRV